MSYLDNMYITVRLNANKFIIDLYAGIYVYICRHTQTHTQYKCVLRHMGFLTCCAQTPLGPETHVLLANVDRGLEGVWSDCSVDCNAHVQSAHVLNICATCDGLFSICGFQLP